MLKLTREEEFAILTLDRPEALNALSFDILRSLESALVEASGWDIRALIVTGSGEKSFCAGADIEELASRSMSEERRGALLGQGVFTKVNRFRVPTIAAINGYA